MEQKIEHAEGTRMECSLTTRIHWEHVAYTWEIKDFIDFREMAESELTESSSRLESRLFGNEESGAKFVLWLFPNGQKQHSSVGSIDLSLMSRGERHCVIAKWSACFLDENDVQIPRTKLRDPLKKYTKGGDGRRFSYSPSESSVNKWLANGALRIRCDVEVAVESHSDSMVDLLGIQTNSLATDVVDYCRSEDALDVTLICGSRSFKASRFMLSARSEVLQAMLNGNFKEGRCGEIELVDVTPHTAKQMLDFVHTDTCVLLEPSDKRKVAFNVHDVLDLFLAADKYDIKCLSAKCLEVLIVRMDEASCVEIMSFAEQTNCQPLVKAGKSYLKQMTGWNTWQRLRHSSCTPSLSISVCAYQVASPRGSSVLQFSCTSATTSAGSSPTTCRADQPDKQKTKSRESTSKSRRTDEDITMVNALWNSE